MDHSSDELLELAYELLVVDDESAEMIRDTLSDRELNIILSIQEQIKKKWSYGDAFS